MYLCILWHVIIQLNGKCRPRFDISLCNLEMLDKRWSNSAYLGTSVFRCRMYWQPNERICIKFLRLFQQENRIKSSNDVFKNCRFKYPLNIQFICCSSCVIVQLWLCHTFGFPYLLVISDIFLKMLCFSSVWEKGENVKTWQNETPGGTKTYVISICLALSVKVSLQPFTGLSPTLWKFHWAEKRYFIINLLNCWTFLILICMYFF